MEDFLGIKSNTGGLLWDEDYSNRKVYSSKATADARVANPDGTNGGFNNATVVSE